MKRNQGSLEYIIIIGGVIILAAATYFMLRGFSQTTGAGTTEQIGVAEEKYMLELENLGRSETRFSAKKWGSLALAADLPDSSLSHLSRLVLGNEGEETTAEICLFNLSSYGLDLARIMFGFNDSGSIIRIEHELETSCVNFTTPLLTSGIPGSPSLTEVLLFHDNWSALELDNLNYTSSDPNVTIVDGTVPEISPDAEVPEISISSIALGRPGSVRDADIKVTVDGTGSRVAEVYYSIGGSEWFRADSLYYQEGEIIVEAHASDYSYDNESEIIHIIANVPSVDNYTVRVHAVDEYGNTRTVAQEVSIVAGAGMGPVIRLAGSDPYSYRSGGGRIAVYGENVHVIWKDDRDGNWEIYYKNSSDGGATWSEDYRLTYDSSSSHFTPAIAVSGDNVHVIWNDDRDGNWEIYYKNSSDGGVTWSEDYRLTYIASDSYEPAIAVSGDNVHVVWYWYGDGNHEIYYKNSSDGGATWSEDYWLTYNVSSSSQPAIAVNGDEVHVVWNDDRDGNDEIYYKNSSDGAVTWTNCSVANCRLTYIVSNSYDPAIAVSGDNVHVVWLDERDGNWEIYYKNSSDGGVTWSEDYRLTYDSSSSHFTPAIAVSGNNVHVVWYDYYDTYYKKSSDGGATWSEDYRFSDPGIFRYVMPDIAVSGSVAHVVWSLWADNYWGVSYRRCWG